LAADTKVLEAPAALAAHKKSGTSGPIWQREQLLVSSIAACDDAFVELNLLLSALALTHSPGRTQKNERRSSKAARRERARREKAALDVACENYFWQITPLCHARRFNQ
jgi:hypothetical protein